MPQKFYFDRWKLTANNHPPAFASLNTRDVGYIEITPGTPGYVQVFYIVAPGIHIRRPKSKWESIADFDTLAAQRILSTEKNQILSQLGQMINR